MPLKPYTGTFGKAQLLHLLRRTMFGVKKEDLNAFKGMSLNQVVNALTEFPTGMDNHPAPPVKNYSQRVNGALDPTQIDLKVPFKTTWVDTQFAPSEATNPDGARRQSFKSWWTGLMVHQERNIREKMVLFLHNLIATESNEVGSGILTYRTNKLFREYAVGNYKDLIYNVSIDGGMLRYLNGERSTKAAPDENYGRELQELFTVGKGPDSKYTEDDVKAAAKLLTGWQISQGSDPRNNPTVPMTVFTLSRHDITDKKFSAFYNNTIIKGQNSIDGGAKELQALINMIFANNEVAKYLARRLYIYFVYYEVTPEVETEVIEPLADIIRSNNYELKPALKALFNSDYFYKAFNFGCLIKSPPDFVIGKVRTFNLPIPDASKLEAQYIMWATIRATMSNMGQDLGDPPNVAGWPAYYQQPSFHEMWVDTATYPVRKTTYEAITNNGLSSGNNTYEAESKGILAKANFVDFVRKFENPSEPNALIDEAVELLYGVPVSKEVKDKLKSTYLLQGQTSDYYWTDAFNEYVANPSTTDPDARRVPTILKELFLDMQSAAEYHLC